MGKHIHLLKLSDEFRRNAAPPELEYGLLVSQTRELALLVDDYEDHLGPYHWLNIGALESIQDKLVEMTQTADMIDKKKMMLPFRKDNDIAVIIQEEILNPHGLCYDPVLFGRFIFMEKDYDRDLSDHGRINIKIQTAFSRDTRDIIDIADNVAAL